MRAIILLAATVTILVTSAYAERLSSDEAKSLVEKARLVRQAYADSDFDTILRTAHPAMIKMLGGREQAAAVLRTMVDQLRARGVRTLETNLSEPGEIYRSGEEIVCFIPRKSLMAVSKKKIVSIGFVIAARKESGGEWTFMDGSGLQEHPELLRTIFPDLPGDVILPETKMTPVSDETNQLPAPAASGGRTPS